MAPRIGSDEWVALQRERSDSYTGRHGWIVRQWDRVNWWVRLALVAGIGALVPTLTGDSDYWIGVGVSTLLLAMLALGLNIVAGWTGLLDLGYIAFYGAGAYGYALLSSNQIYGGIHLNTWLAVFVVTVGCALVGVIVGLPSRRLGGDYLAIVTLFFGLAFIEAVTLVKPSWTGGPNGIVNVDPITIFGKQLFSTSDYYYFLLVVTALLIAMLKTLHDSRTGLAWRAVREDPLAAEHMTIPVDRVKLMAFSFGAGVAALTGTIFAAFQTGVYPTSFDTTFLILVYAAIILGGSGSIAGAVLGAVVLNVTLELMRTTHDAEYIFYGLVLSTLIARLRPWRKLAAVLGALIVFGFVVHAITTWVAPHQVTTHAQGGGWIGRAVSHWVVVPTSPTTIGNISCVVLVVACLVLVEAGPRWRPFVLVPVLYLAAFAWEARLIVEPTITREILLGGLLLFAMIARPQGLVGKARVELA
jgi:branched-chain amino acid transport system permease protein